MRQFGSDQTLQLKKVEKKNCIQGGCSTHDREVTPSLSGGLSMISHRSATSELVHLFGRGSLSGFSDFDLLTRFVADRDALAFETLVVRHGPMVLGICRRMLNDPSEADDAFQATFLVLLRRAGSLGPGDVLPAWLHGVAVRVAKQARAVAARRARRERTGMIVEAPTSGDDPVDRELGRILDEEIHRLPLKYRAPVVLCYLEGMTHEEAAQRLQWPVGSVKGRLSRARTLLQSRLTRRGVACGAALGGLTLSSTALAMVPDSLLASTCRAAGLLGSGPLAPAILSTSVSGLLEGALSAMFMHKVRMFGLAFLASGLFLSGAGVMVRNRTALASPQPEKAAAGVEQKKDAPRSETSSEFLAGAMKPPEGQGPEVEKPAGPPAPVRPSNEASGSSSHSGSARLTDPGSILRDQLFPAARRLYLEAKEAYERGHGSIDRAYHASRLLMDTERGLAETPADRRKSIEAHRQRMRDLARVEKRTRSGEADEAIKAEAHAYVVEADLLLTQDDVERAAIPFPDTQTIEYPSAELWRSLAERRIAQSLRAADGKAVESKPSDARDTDPRSRQILEKLEEPIPMSFANETPLEDLLKYIKSATAGSKGAGIPIYVDPLGLQEAERSLTSPIQLDLEGVPLRRTLQLALEQLGLVYYVDDGILVITNEGSEQTGLRPTTVKPSPFHVKQERAERGEMSIEELKQFVEELKVRKQMKELLDEIQYGRRPGGGIQ
jgi:RNA polymerase sigma factor (sigma-70 family)